VTEDEIRVLPHALDAERAVLGAILVDGSLIERAAEILRAPDFFRRAHRSIFAAMLRLDHRREPIDPLTLTTDLTRTGELQEVGGAAYLMGLTDGVPQRANVLSYAEIVREHAIRRAVIALSQQMATAAYNGELSATDVVRKADAGLIDLQAGSGIGELLDLRSRGAAIYADLEMRVNNRGKLSGTPTGFVSIDELTLGWQRGDMIVIAARPSIGKTAFVLNTLTAAAQAGQIGALFSLEMKLGQLEHRLLASLAGISLTRLVSGYLSEEDFARIGSAAATLGTLPIYINDRSAVTFWDIRAACRRLKHEAGALDLVVIDYIQLMRPDDSRRYENRTQAVTEMSRQLKLLADECAVPVIVLSQLNRGADTRADKRPILSDLRESGALEQDADLVCFLHRKHHRESGPTDFVIEKQRNGPTGTVILSIDRDTQTFTDAGPMPEQATLPDAPAAAEAVPASVRKWRRGR
jgi:replicative DNA helicase